MLGVKWNRCPIISAELPSSIRAAVLMDFHTYTGMEVRRPRNRDILSEARLMQFYCIAFPVVKQQQFKPCAAMSSLLFGDHRRNNLEAL